MFEISQLPKHEKSKQALIEADQFFLEHWLIGDEFVNKTFANKKFGRNQANIALTRYFNIEQRGCNLTKKITKIKPKNFDDLSSEIQEKILVCAKFQDIEKDLDRIFAKKPIEYDLESVIKINVDNYQKAIDWCVDHEKIHLIKPVRIIMSLEKWNVFYNLKTDRFYSFWPFCLTNWPKELRKLILSGIDLDIINSIGQFIFIKTHTKLDKFPLVKRYLEFPNDVRDELSKEMNISLIQAKKVLHATVNGAMVNKGAISIGKSALLDLVNMEQALFYIKHYKKFISQLRSVRNLIAPSNKEFMRSYFNWERSKTGSFFNGTGLIMHDGIDGCSLETEVPGNLKDGVMISGARGMWSKEKLIDQLVEI